MAKLRRRMLITKMGRTTIRQGQGPVEQSQGRGRTGEVLDVSVGNGGKVTPPRDRGGAERVEMFVNDCKGSGHGPAGEANASDCLVMFNKMGKGPHGQHNVLADALDEPVMHGKEKGGGRGIGGVRVCLVRHWWRTGFQSARSVLGPRSDSPEPVPPWAKSKSSTIVEKEKGSMPAWRASASSMSLGPRLASGIGPGMRHKLCRARRANSLRGVTAWPSSLPPKV